MTTTQMTTQTELHLIASAGHHGDPDDTARCLGVYASERDAIRAGVGYLLDVDPGAWVQVCATYGQGRDVTIEDRSAYGAQRGAWTTVESPRRTR